VFKRRCSAQESVKGNRKTTTKHVIMTALDTQEEGKGAVPGPHMTKLRVRIDQVDGWMDGWMDGMSGRKA
jgi:hypothetical protein